jgi:rod shape-determining protein MreD
MPNLFIIFILFIGLFAGKKIGFIFGLICGILIDMFIGKSVGISSILLGAIGLIAEYCDKNFSKDSKLTIIIMVVLSTILYETGAYIFTIIKDGINIEILPFIKILLIEILYNSLLTIILYPVLHNLGYKLENIFKNKTIMTRYF